MRPSVVMTAILAGFCVACQSIPARSANAPPARSADSPPARSADSPPARSAAPPDTAALFPAAQPPITADRTVSVAATAGELTLASYRFAPKAGQTSHPNAMWCGLTVKRHGRAAQALVTIGKGDFETLSCDGLAQAGAMPPKGSAPRIGLIYRTRSPNFASTTPVVLADDPVAGWTVDESVDPALNAMTKTATLPLMRKALAR